MSDFLKNLKSIFVVQAPGQESAMPQAESGAEEPIASSDAMPETLEGGSTPAPVKMTAAGPGQVTDKFMDILLKAVEANNQDGFDYLEYKRALQNLAAMNMDEGTKYKSAFAAAQTMGVTAQSLAKSAQHYLGVLSAEEKKFASALANQRSTQIDGGNQQLKDLDLSVEQKRKQIAQLEKEIAAAEEQRSAIRTKVEAATQKVEQTRSNFVTTYDALLGQIRGDVENIQKYLAN